MKKLLLALFILVLSAPCHSQDIVPMSSDQKNLLNLAQDYLSKVRTFRANFLQVNPDSDVISSGEIYFAKPGMLRMSYASPFGIDYYINDDKITQYDRDLDEVTRGDAPENPLRVLLYDEVTLANNGVMDITNITDDGTTFNIFMLNKAQEIREVNGLILKFRKNPVELMGIQRVDYEGNKTETNLTAVTINKDIDDSVFFFKKPKAAYPSTKY